VYLPKIVADALCVVLKPRVDECAMSEVLEVGRTWIKGTNWLVSDDQG